MNVDRDLVSFADASFMPGQTRVSEITRCLKGSSVFVAVISRNYCNSDYCKYEIQEARRMEKPIFLMFIEEVDQNYMDLRIWGIIRNYLHETIILDNGEYKPRLGWKYFCNFILGLILE